MSETEKDKGIDGLIHNLYVTNTKLKRQQKFTFNKLEDRDRIYRLLCGLKKELSLDELKITYADFPWGSAYDD